MLLLNIKTFEKKITIRNIYFLEKFNFFNDLNLCKKIF